MERALVPVAVWALLCSLSGCAEPVPGEGNRLSPTQLAAEIREALAEPRRVDRIMRSASALSQLAPENLEAVLAVYEEHLEGLEGVELQLFFDKWARLDAPAAFEYSMTIPFQVPAAIAQEASLNSWAVEDVIAARLAAEQATQEMPRKALSFRRPLVRGWAASGQTGLKEYLLMLEDSGPLTLAVLHQIYIQHGVDGLLAWSEDYLRMTDDYGSRMKAFRMTVRTVGLRDPKSVAPFVLAHYGEKYSAEGPRVLTETWVRTDPTAAFEWLRNSAPEEAQAGAVNLATGTWLNHDRAAALDWIRSRPTDDPFYHPAFEALAKQIARRAPESAIEWCERIEASDMRRSCLRYAAIKWYPQNPVEAGLWLEEKSGLSVEDRVDVRDRAVKSLPARNR